MSNIRPGDATHRDKAGQYFKSGLDLNWLKWSQGYWVDVGTLPEGTLTILPPPAVVELEKFDAPTQAEICNAFQVPFQIVEQCVDELCVKEKYGDSDFCFLHLNQNRPAPPSTQVIQPSASPVWPCPPSPSPFEVPLPREQYSGIPVPSTHPAAPQPMHPCAPSPQVHDQAEAYTKLVTSLDDETPFTAYFTEYRFVGSRITCNPPPLDTDQDVLALSYSCDVVERKMLAAGFTKEGSNPADLGGSVDKESVLHSYRKGDMNYIVTGDRAFYERFSTATELARKYNLMGKADRIQLFQAVLYGKWWA